MMKGKIKILLLFLGLIFPSLVQTPLLPLLWEAQLFLEAGHSLLRYWDKDSFHLPPSLSSSKGILSLEYTIDETFQSKVASVLTQSQADYTFVVALDNHSGAIISALSKSPEGFSFDKIFSTKEVAASLFKVVTAAGLLELKKINPETSFSYTGRATTLFKGQLITRYPQSTKAHSLEKAFATSNNPIFAKAAMTYLSSEKLKSVAKHLGIERSLLLEIPVATPDFHDNKEKELFEGFTVGELASGFNRETKITVLHAAVMAMIVANKGTFFRPFFIKKITHQNKIYSLETLFPSHSTHQRLKKEVALELQQLMQATLLEGTAKSTFRKFKRRFSLKAQDLEIGGKTGSLSDTAPQGKRDWFMAYARSKTDPSKSISLAVLQIHGKFWHQKSSALALELIGQYF